VKSRASVLYFPPCHCLTLCRTDLPIRPSHSLDALFQSCALLILLRPPVVQTERRRYRNINLLSIVYAVRPRLRSRLTLRGRAFLRKPWAFGERDSHSFFATHTGILTSKRSTSPYGLTSQPLERSPTTDPLDQSAASVVCLAPVHFRRRVTRPVSYYALFQ
jgi:hypothetical protein